TTQKVVAKETVRQSWFGLALSPQADKIWWAGGGANMLHTFDLKDGKLTRTSKAEPDPAKMTKEERDKYLAEQAKQKAFKAGLCLDAKNNILYSLDINAGTLTAINLKDGSTTKSAPCGSRPYDVALSKNGTRLYVSDWATRTVLAVSTGDLRVVTKV